MHIRHPYDLCPTLHRGPTAVVGARYAESRRQCSAVSGCKRRYTSAGRGNRPRPPDSLPAAVRLHRRPAAVREAVVQRWVAAARGAAAGRTTAEPPLPGGAALLLVVRQSAWARRTRTLTSSFFCAGKLDFKCDTATSQTDCTCISAGLVRRRLRHCHAARAAAHAHHLCTRCVFSGACFAAASLRWIRNGKLGLHPPPLRQPQQPASCTHRCLLLPRLPSPQAGCFSGTSSVATPAGPKRLSQLQLGEAVLSVGAGGALQFSPVYMFSSRRPAERSAFLRVRTDAGLNLTGGWVGGAGGRGRGGWLDPLQSALQDRALRAGNSAHGTWLCSCATPVLPIPPLTLGPTWPPPCFGVCPVTPGHYLFAWRGEGARAMAEAALGSPAAWPYVLPTQASPRGFGGEGFVAWAGLEGWLGCCSRKHWSWSIRCSTNWKDLHASESTASQLLHARPHAAPLLGPQLAVGDVVPVALSHVVASSGVGAARPALARVTAVEEVVEEGVFMPHTHRRVGGSGRHARGRGGGEAVGRGGGGGQRRRAAWQATGPPALLRCAARRRLRASSPGVGAGCAAADSADPSPPLRRRDCGRRCGGNRADQPGAPCVGGLPPVARLGIHAAPGVLGAARERRGGSCGHAVALGARHARRGGQLGGAACAACNGGVMLVGFNRPPFH